MATSSVFRLWVMLVGLVLAIFLAALTARVQPAEAAFPGKNGKIAFERSDARTQTSSIYTVKRDGTGLTKLATGTRFFYASDPSWSPDGRRLAFTGNRGDNGNIYVLQVANGELKQITNGERGGSSPSWSPDGKRIVFYRFKETDGTNIYTIKVDGTGLKRLAHAGAGVYLEDPVWSPEGKIAFSSGGQESPAEIFVMNANGSEEKKLTKRKHNFDAGPAWSPDGKKIAFGRFAGSKVGTLVMDTDGSGVRRISRNVGFDLDWQPRP